MIVFDTETNLIVWKEILFNQIKLNFNDILDVAKEWSHWCKNK